jgi:Tfp pilus assembly protein PilF
VEAERVARKKKCVRFVWTQSVTPTDANYGAGMSITANALTSSVNECRKPLPPCAIESAYQASLIHTRAYQAVPKGCNVPFHDRLLTEAEQLFREALQDDPQHVLAHYNLAVILGDGRHDIDGAEREYRAAIKCDPQCAHAHCNLGLLLCNHRQDFDGAEHAYREAIKYDPYDALSHDGLGRVLDAVQDIEGAERAFRTAI